jgi:dihydroxy-acid dehydratase
MVMAMARLNLPSVMLYGGSIAFGEYKGRRLTIQEVFEAIGAFNAKRSTRASSTRSRAALPGRRRLRRQFTANTMSTAFEMLGVSPMGWNGIRPPTRARKRSRSTPAS